EMPNPDDAKENAKSTQNKYQDRGEPCQQRFQAKGRSQERNAFNVFFESIDLLLPFFFQRFLSFLQDDRVLLVLSREFRNGTTQLFQLHFGTSNRSLSSHEEIWVAENLLRLDLFLD